MESWPFKVIDDEGNPKVEVEYLGGTHKFSPQEISAMVLTKVGSPLCMVSGQR
jgi:heat shock protein 1/8